MPNKLGNKTEVLLKHLLSLTNDAYYIADEDGTLIFVNEKACENVAVEKPALMAMKMQNLDTRFNSAEKWNALIERLKQENQIIFDGAEKKGNELVFPTETRLSYFFGEDYNYVIAVALDTYEKKNAEELLLAKKAKEQFLANMSHEIRTPINGISGMLNLLSDTEATQEQQKYIHAIQDATTNLKVIINDILDISAIESGKLRFERIGFKPDYQVLSVIQSFRLQAQEKGIVIKHTISNEAKTVLLGDPVRLNQILMNLIGNALKFTFSGEILVEVKVANRLSDKLFVEFAVKDSGMGIPKDKLSVIFDSFRQADESVTRRFGGTGLGLTICKQLTEMQNGTISVESEEGKGATFKFIIPYNVGKDEDLANSQSKTGELVEKDKIDYTYLKGLSILLVEDNDINRIYARNTVQKWGCSVDIAENGLIALEKIRKNNYHIILMDIQMPVMDGFEATKTIRNKFEPPKSNIPIIALTANAIKGDDQKCLEAGMNDYISKPFAPYDLYFVLRKYVKNLSLKLNDKKKQKGTSNAQKHSKQEKMNDISLIDLSYLEGICDGDQQFIAEMVRSFIKDIPKILEEMLHHKKAKEWVEVGKLAHKLKPSVQFMGIGSIELDVKTLETECKNGINLSKAPERVDLLVNVISKAISELEAMQIK